MITTLHKGNGFSIIRNDRAQLAIVMDVREDWPSSARIVYDGGDTMLLFRHLEPVLLEGITPFARGHILNATKILVSEFSDDGNMVYEYTAPVIQVPDVKPYMCLLEDDWSGREESALEIPINVRQMEDEENAYKQEKQARLDRLIDQLVGDALKL